MTTTPEKPGPGTCLLAQQLGLADPLATLAAQHPPGDRLRRPARALIQTATELDAAYARAQEAGRELRALRGQLSQGLEGGDAVRREISLAAAELELALERCEVLDTALIRLLGIYLDVVQTPGPG